CPGPCWSAVFSPDSRTISVAGESYVMLWDAATGRMVREFEHVPSTRWRLGYDGRRLLTFSPDGSLPAAAGVYDSIHLWSVATGREVDTLQGPGGKVLSLAFSPDGRRLITGSEDTTALVWDLTLLGG